MAPRVRNLPAMQETQTWVPSLSREDPLEEGMEIHSSVLAWRIPWTEELGRLESVGHRIRHFPFSKTAFLLVCTFFQ